MMSRTTTSTGDSERRLVPVAPNNWLYVRGLSARSMQDAERLFINTYNAMSFQRLTESSAYVSFVTIEAATKVSDDLIYYTIQCNHIRALDSCGRFLHKKVMQQQDDQTISGDKVRDMFKKPDPTPSMKNRSAQRNRGAPIPLPRNHSSPAQGQAVMKER